MSALAIRQLKEESEALRAEVKRLNELLKQSKFDKWAEPFQDER